MEQAIESGTPSIRVAELDGQLIGWVSFGPSRDQDVPIGTAELMAIYIDPAFWACGIGTALWAEARQALRSYGYQQVIVWVPVLSTLGGYGLYWVCLRRSSATRVASVLYLSPPITLLWAWAMFDEPLSWPMAAGMALSAVGICLVVRAEPRQASRDERKPNHPTPR